MNQKIPYTHRFPINHIVKYKFIEIIKNYNNSPVAYGIDIGIDNANNSFVVEVNDATSLGNYGLDSIRYSEMLIARWFELVTAPRLHYLAVERFPIRPGLKWAIPRSGRTDPGQG